MPMEPDSIRDEMVTTARKRLERYDQVVGLAEEQKAILVEGRHSELTENLTKFDPLLLELKQLGKREEALRRHLERAQADGQVASSSSLDAEYAKTADLTAEKTSVLRTLTETNKQLLANASEFMRFSIGIICRAAAEQQPGLDIGGNPAIMLDLRV